MKKIFITLISLTVVVSSCRKIIDIELDEADKRTSIDARILRGTNNVTARVTKSGNFFGKSTTSDLTDATITLNDGATDYPLINLGNGNYSLANFNASDNQSYTMKVTQGGTTSEASSFMPKLIEIDTISYEFQAASTFNDEGYVLTIEFQDEAGIANFYRIEVDIAGERYGAINDLILLDDELTDGNRIEFPLFGADIAQLGDTVTVYLLSLEKQSYKYFEAVDEILFGDGAAPANPKSNWNNNALGNFSAIASDTMTVVIQ